MHRKLNFLIPSIADILFLSITLRLALNSGGDLLGDGDTGYHIRAGEYILTTFSIPKLDMFSFLSPPLPWTAHEWLSEVIMALIHRYSGLTGIVLFFSFLIALTFYLLFKILRGYKGYLLSTVIVAVLAIGSSQIHWLARPHIFSFLLILGWYHLLDDFQYRNKNRLYLLPFIMLLWVNLHGGYMAGFMLLGIYLIGNVLQLFHAGVDEKTQKKKNIKVLCLASAACVAAVLINPYGYHILLFPFRLTSNKFLMDNVAEFLSPSFHEPMPFTYLLLLAITVFSISKKSLNVIELQLVLLFTYMSLYSARYIPLFAIITAPVLIKHIEPLVNNATGKLITFLKRRSDRIASVDGSARGYFWPIISLLLVIVLASSGSISFSFDKKEKPVDAIEFLKRERVAGNMFNNDEFGDYVIYTAWPQYKVFFDGRSDMYGTDRLKEYFKLSRVQPGWEDVLKKYRIDWIFYNANSSLSLFLLEREDWKLIYADKVANIFVRNIPAYQHLIQKYTDVKLVIEKDKKEKGS